MEELTRERKAELRECLASMSATSSAFYSSAVKIGNHTFIEFCGLMNEYIKVCRDAFEQNIDFTMCSKHSGLTLPLQGYHVRYLGEKIGCIYGEMLKEPGNWEVFEKTVKES